jgi:hypothetical protein
MKNDDRIMVERDEGNGFLSRGYDSGGLWYGLGESFH